MSFTLTEEEIKKIPILGIAGNFAGHLAQAGEADISSKNTMPASDKPSGIFPIYFPKMQNYLGIYPVSNTQILADFSHPIALQLEAETCILFEVCYQDRQVSQLNPKAFSVFNDCSLRKIKTDKLSEKKNWGTCSTGLGEQWRTINDFSAQGDFAQLHLTAYLRRHDKIMPYGIDTPIQNYQCFNQSLIDWIIDALNFQPDEGAFPELHYSFIDMHQPDQMIISLGATRYTDFGQTGFLQPEDEIGLFIYDSHLTTASKVKDFFAQNLPAEQFQPGLALIQTISNNNLTKV